MVFGQVNCLLTPVCPGVSGKRLYRWELTMSDMTLWLQNLGLEKYDEVLSGHDIDLAVVPDLTEQDLEKLGLSLGHRRKFIAAAVKLRAVTAPPAAAAAQGQSS